MTATAIAGETYIREQKAYEGKIRAENNAYQDRLDKERKLQETMLEVERKLGHAIGDVNRALNSFESSGPPDPSGAGEHLAQHTAAVVAAYEELAAQYRTS